MNARKHGVGGLNSWAGLLGMAWVVVVCGALSANGMGREHPTSEHPTSKEILDDKTFEGKIGAKGETSGDADKLVFKRGKFVSTACVKYGFDKVSYSATEKDGSIEFTSEATNKKGETMSWKGTVKDDQVKATALYQSGSEEIEYWFKGSLASGTSEHPKKSEKSEHPKKSEHPQ